MKSTSSRGIKALLGYLWRYRGTTLLGVVGLLVADVAQLSIPYLSKLVIDQLQFSPQQLRLGPTVSLMVGLAVLAYLARCLWRYCLFGVARRCDVEIRSQIYQRAVALSPEGHTDLSSGKILSLATSDVLAVRYALAFALMSTFDAVMYTLLSLSAMVHLNARLALYTLLPFPILALAMKYLLQWNYQLWDRVQSSLDEMTEKARESIAGMRVLRSMVQAEGDARDFHRHTHEVYRRFLRFVRVDGVYTPAITLLAGTSFTLLLAMGGADVAAGEMSIGDFAAFASFLGQLTWPMIAAAWTLSLVQRGSASMERILELLDRPPEPDQPAVEASESGHLRVEQLVYRYPQGGHRPALDGLSFEVLPGGSLGLVGEVGSGKSTLLRLWLRLYAPPRGGLWMDGHDVLDWNLNQLRQRVAWVEQESFLFSMTIAENLKLQQQHLSHEEVVAAAKLAELHDEVMSFPQGYDTLLGERGITLSGGQKQRLCLARALLKPAPFLVLDDTLSAVDADTERRILEGLKKRRSQQTLLVISHRISAVQELDEILVLEAGKVVQRGRHDELLQAQGLYRQLYELQSKEGR